MNTWLYIEYNLTQNGFELMGHEEISYEETLKKVEPFLNDDKTDIRRINTCCIVTHYL